MKGNRGGVVSRLRDSGLGLGWAVRSVRTATRFAGGPLRIGRAGTSSGRASTASGRALTASGRALTASGRALTASGRGPGSLAASGRYR
jgi:hypothetical protein